MNMATEFVSKLFKVPSAEIATVTEMPMTSDNNAPPPNKKISDQRTLYLKRNKLHKNHLHCVAFSCQTTSMEMTTMENVQVMWMMLK